MASTSYHPRLMAAFHQDPTKVLFNKEIYWYGTVPSTYSARHLPIRVVDLVGSGKISPDPDPIGTLATYVKLYKQGKNIKKIELLHIFR